MKEVKEEIKALIDSYFASDANAIKKRIGNLNVLELVGLAIALSEIRQISNNEMELRRKTLNLSNNDETKG